METRDVDGLTSGGGRRNLNGRPLLAPNAAPVKKMPVSGLILSLAADPALAESALATIATRSEFVLGERAGRQVPAAADARDDAHARDLHDWLMALPGIEFVDVVYVNFSGDDDGPAPAEAGTDCRTASAAVGSAVAHAGPPR